MLQVHRVDDAFDLLDVRPFMASQPPGTEMGKHIVCGPLTGVGGRMQLSWCQTGGKRGDSPRRCCEQRQDLLCRE